jgi:hypothetical protein
MLSKCVKSDGASMSRKEREAASPTFDAIPRKHKRIEVTPSPDLKRMREGVVVRYQDTTKADFCVDLTNQRPFIIQKELYVRIDNILYKIDVEADSERCSLYGYFLAFDILIRFCRLVLM